MDPHNELVSEFTPPRPRRRPLPSLGHPWFTRAVMAACIGIHFSLRAEQNPGLYSTLAPYGIVPVQEIWKGAVWGLVTPTAVHFDLLHLAFNVYWLWILGQVMEQAVGTLKFVGFYVLAAAVGSLGEILVIGSTGVGASGAVYAIFGFMWMTRLRWADFTEIMTPQIAKLMFVWLFLCIPLTYFGILPIANGAHFAGIGFGLAAGALVMQVDKLRAAG